MIIRPTGQGGRLPQGTTLNANHFPKMRLPDEYQEVEYIQSSGTQYILTNNVYPQNGDKIEVEAYLNRASFSSEFEEKTYIGVWDSNGATIGFQFGWQDSSHPSSIFNAYYAKNWNSISSILAPVNIGWHKVELTNSAIKLDGTSYNISTPSTFTFSSGALALGGFPIFGAAYLSWEGLVKNVSIFRAIKWYRNDALLYNFIPCYRKSDNEIGMYDLVNNVFYTNDGTGTFTKGNDVSLTDLYTEVEYIQSSGTQYIDTGFIPNQDTKIEMDSIVSNTASLAFMPYGAAEDYNSRSFECYYISTSSSGYEINYGSSYQYVFTNIALNDKVKIIQNKNIAYVTINDGATSTLTYSLSTFTTPYTMYLFGIHRASSLFGSLKMLSFKIYDNGTLIRDFIPCYRNSDNVAGMYDIVNHVFYTNAGTGVFTAGDIIKTYEVLNPKKSITGFVPTHDLPSEYQEVEYIVSSGTQYIDTGLNTSSNNVKIMIDFSDGSLNAWESYFGNAGIRLVRNSTDNVLKALWNTDASYGTTSTMDLTQRTLLYMDKNGLYDKDMNTILSNSSSITDAKNVLIFLSYYSGSLDNKGSFKLYNFKMWNNAVLVRDFVPCYRKSDNEIGLYDIVNNVFYTNSGTGTFIIPPQTVEIKNVYLGETRVYGDDPTQQLVNYAMLYDAGDECASITGGYVFGRFITDYGTRTGTGEKRSTSLYVKSGSSGSLVSAGYFTTNKINLADFSKAFYNIISVDKVFTCKVVINPTDRLFGGSNLEISTTGLASIATGGYSEAYVGFGSWAYGSMIETNAIFVTKQDNWQQLCTVAGLTPSSYIDEADLCSNSSAMNIILGNQNAVNYMIKRCTGSFMGAFAASSTALTALNNSTYKTTIQANEHWAKFLTMVA